MFVQVWRRIIQSIPRSRSGKLVLIASISTAFLLNCQTPAIMSSSNTIPSAYIPHGGGPLPILGDSEHKTMISWLSSFVSKYLTNSNYKPTSCLIISAHWEAPLPTIQSGETTSLYYDYYGFPEETYNLNYSLKPAPELSQRVATLLKDAGIKYEIDKKRGYDHGVFIPMMLLYPEGNVPTLQISLISGLDPEKHIKLGEALAPLRNEGVFILGSGMSYHNMRGFRSGTDSTDKDSIPFHNYLRSVLTNDDKSYEDKKEGLKEWKKAPKAKEVHPREEHLIPLMVILGTAKETGGKGIKEVFFDHVGGAKCAGYLVE